MSEYETVRQAAKRVSTSRQRIYAAIKSGELRATRIGPHGLRIALEDLERWVGRDVVEPRVKRLRVEEAAGARG
jgi:excisionase family DNA binding protein